MKKIFLSIIIPCYNEKGNLKRKMLAGIEKYLRGQKFSWEVIISDDGSNDGSQELIQSQIRNWKNFDLLKNAHGGKPFALWHGIQKAKGEYVLFTDMDQSTPIVELDKLLPFINDGYPVVIGSRGIDRKSFPFYRKLGSLVFMSVRKAFILSDIDDTQCGFKIFKRTLAKKTFPKLEFFRRQSIARGWTVTSYDVELLHIIEKTGEKIKEVRVTWEDADVSKSKGGGLSRYVKESREMLTQILRVKLNDMRGMYD